MPGHPVVRLATASAAIAGALALASPANGGAELARPLARLDPLVVPARPSRLANRSVLVAATRAGNRWVAVGERGIVMLSDDAGRSWRQAQVPVSVTLTAVQFLDARSGWAVGHSGVILHTSDGGQTWRKQLDGLQVLELLAPLGDAEAKLRTRIERARADGPDRPFLAVHFSSAQEGLAVGAYGLAFATSDGGAHWQPALQHFANEDERHLYAILERADGLFVAGEQGQLWKRAPGANHFAPLTTGFKNTIFGMISGRDGALFAFGLGGFVHRSADGGATWQSARPAGSAALTAALSLPDVLLFASESGQVHLSRDSGRSFQVADLPPFPAAGLADGSNGQLLVVGPLGVKPLALPSTNVER